MIDEEIERRLEGGHAWEFAIIPDPFYSSARETILELTEVVEFLLGERKMRAITDQIKHNRWGTGLDL